MNLSLGATSSNPTAKIAQMKDSCRITISTPLKTNMEPKKGPLKKNKNHLQTRNPQFPGFHVSFRGCLYILYDHNQ